MLDEPLHTGDNALELTYYGYGSRDLKTLTATLTLPEGKPVNGEIEVMPAGWDWWYFEDESDDPAPATLKAIVDDLNSRPNNSDLLLTFYPRSEGDWRPPDDSSAPALKTSGPYDGDDTTYDPVEVTIEDTGWVFDGWLLASTVPVVLDARPAKLDFGQRAMLRGEIMGVTEDVEAAVSNDRFSGFKAS